MLGAGWTTCDGLDVTTLVTCVGFGNLSTPCDVRRLNSSGVSTSCLPVPEYTSNID